MKYDVDAHGNILMFPLSGWTSAALPDDHLLIVLEYVPSPVALETGERRQVQLAMTRAQAREAAAWLARSAEMPYLPRA